MVTVPAGECGQAFPCIVDKDDVKGVARAFRAPASRILEHTVEGILCRVGGHGNKVDGLVDAHGVASGLGVSVVNPAAVGYLVIHAVGPVVVCHVVIFGVDVAVDIELSPYVPHLVPLVGAVGVVAGVL